MLRPYRSGEKPIFIGFGVALCNSYLSVAITLKAVVMSAYAVVTTQLVVVMTAYTVVTTT